MKEHSGRYPYSTNEDTEKDIIKNVKEVYEKACGEHIAVFMGDLEHVRYDILGAFKDGMTEENVELVIVLAKKK